MVVFTINTTVEQEFLFPITLAVRAVQIQARTSSSIFQIERSKSIDYAMLESEHEKI